MIKNLKYFMSKNLLTIILILVSNFLIAQQTISGIGL